MNAVDTIIAASPIAMIVVDAGLHVTLLNAAAETLLNSSASATLGRPLGEIVGLPNPLPRDAAFSSYDHLLRPTRGPAHHVDLHLTPLGDPAGATLLSLHPVRGAAPFGQRSHTSRSAIGAAAMLAHEIKNPLAAIRGAAQLLRGDEREPLTQLICNEVDRVARLIDGMQDFTDARPLQRGSYNVHALVDRAIATARSAHSIGGVIREHYDPSLPQVLVCPDSIVQVVLNLLTNALEAATGDASIRVETRYRHGVTVIEADGVRTAVPIEVAVIDDGAGPPADLVEHLFEPFVSTKSRSRGLGLALVDKLVRDNGGLVQFAREGQPPTTVFRILLPMAV